MSVDASQCNENVLAQMAASASTLQNPVEPYPMFFNAENCKSSTAIKDSKDDATFPSHSFTTDCSGTEIPKADSNCLRIVTDYDNTFNPLAGPPIPRQYVNALPSEVRGVTQSNVFSDVKGRLFSWYCPPQYLMVFYTADPSTHTREAATAGGYLLVPPNTVQPNACRTLQSLNNGQYFFKYSGDNNPTGCLAAWCGACSKPEDPMPEANDFCKTPVAYKDCPAIDHNAPWFVVVKRLEFTKMLLNMCLSSTPYYLGSTENSLNRVWAPQGFGCDALVTNLCYGRNPADAKYEEMCSCFAQQKSLDNEFGTDLQVSVCCFGQDASKETNKACFFNKNAYKTNDMLKRCCSFAQCQQIVTETAPGKKMQSLTDTPGQIKCAGDFVVFPVAKKDAVPDTTFPKIFTETVVSIPAYVWILLAMGVGFLFLFIFILAFV